MNERTPSPEELRRQGMDYGETEDVQQVHAAIQREKTEPRVGLEPLSIWLIGIYGLAVFFGGAYLGRFSGGFSGSSLDFGNAPQAKIAAGGGAGGGAAAELSPADRGKKVFMANCATCHQANGLGIAGQYPPLDGSEYVTGGTRRLGMILLKGLEGPIVVKGQPYGSAVMQAWEKTLNDQKIADVLTYIRSAWSNKADAVAKESIGALRKEMAGQDATLHADTLNAIPADAMLPGGAAAEPAPAAGAAAPPKS